MMRWLPAALVLAMAAVLIAGSFTLDAPVRTAVLDAQGKGWKRSPEAKFHGLVRKVGDWPWLMVAGTAGFALAWKLGSRRWMRVVAVAMLASTLAGVVANASRLTTGRTRPRASPELSQGFYGPVHEGHILIGNSKYNSFPSGHAATAFGFALPFLAASVAVGLVMLAGACLVGWSSLALGAHHPSDIVVSILLALAASTLAARMVDRHGVNLARKVLALWHRR
jgi:membrane-associated phospholipid phosphatase